MSMSWAGKIKNAIEGLVPASDVLGRLASTSQLASFRQQLSDQRLEAEIGNLAEPWRAAFALAPVAAPLWLAESLVTIAQSLVEAEVAAHPDRKDSMAALTHGQVQALLEPVETLQSEISGILADPHRRSRLTLPLLARPFAHTDAGLKSERVPVSYVRGLLAGATSVAGSAQLLVADYAAFFEHPTAPAWMKSAFTVIKGDLAAAQSRLDAAESRGVSIFHQQVANEPALQELAIDLWDLTNTILKRGQQITAPGLLPGFQQIPSTATKEQIPSPQPTVTQTPPSQASGSPGTAPRASEPQQARQETVVSRPVTEPAGNYRPPPVPPPPPEPARTMPTIGAGPGDLSRPASGQPAAHPPQPEPPRAMPSIGTRPGDVVQPSAGQPPAARPPQPEASAAMPQIGGPPSKPEAPRAMPSIGAGPGDVTRPPSGQPAARPPQPEAPKAMPQIGGAPSKPEAAAAPSAPAADRPAVSASQSPEPGARRIDRKDRWMLSGTTTRHRLRAAGQEDQAERDLAAFWEARGWSLTGPESRYLDEVANLVASGAVSASGRSQAACPFAPHYRVVSNAIALLGHTLNRGAIFTYEYQSGGRGLVTDLQSGSGVADTP